MITCWNWAAACRAGRHSCGGAAARPAEGRAGWPASASWVVRLRGVAGLACAAGTCSRGGRRGAGRGCARPARRTVGALRRTGCASCYLQPANHTTRTCRPAHVTLGIAGNPRYDIILAPGCVPPGHLLPRKYHPRKIIIVHRLFLIYCSLQLTIAGLSSRVVSASDCGVRGSRFESRR